MTVEDELAIRGLLAAYCRRLDDGDFVGASELFTADGTFAFGKDAPTGTEALARWFEGMQPPERRGMHATVNALIELDGDRASAVSDFLFVRWIDGALAIELAGRYRDALVRLDDQWRIQRRETVLLRSPR